MILLNIVYFYVPHFPDNGHKGIVGRGEQLPSIISRSLVTPYLHVFSLQAHQGGIQMSEDLSNMVREVMEKIYFCIKNIYIYFTILVSKRYVTTRCSELHRILQAT